MIQRVIDKAIAAIMNKAEQKHLLATRLVPTEDIAGKSGSYPPNFTAMDKAIVINAKRCGIMATQSTSYFLKR